MKNILVFTYGDSNNPSTWSNVPYLLTTTFEKKGYNVIRVDMSPKKNIIYYIHTLFFKIIKPSTTYYYVRSKSNRKKVEKIIKEAVEKYDDIVDLYISISYDFSPSKFTNKKVLLISDWPIEYALENRYNRKPDWLEINDVNRHKIVIESATYRVSLFQDVANYMNNRFNCKTEYLGAHINSFKDIDGFENLDNRNKITFIGKKSYYSSAKNLIFAFEKLDNKIVKEKRLELHIIGMNKKDFPGINSKNIYFHGYLDKGNENECNEYYKILSETLVIVNTSEKWAGISSILESMYYYRPIITSKFDEFVKTFGNDIDFGYYCSNNEQEIEECLYKIIKMNKKDYKKMAFSSHNSVKDYSYDSFVDKIINLVK
jgi:glycosyltransferase involved in cell wall biosynthesis